MPTYDRTINLSLEPVGQPGGHVTIKNPMWLKQRELTALQGASGDPAVLTTFLSGLIEGWNISDYDGTPIPYVAGQGGVDELPLVIVRFIFEAIAKELNVPLETQTS